MVKKHFSKVSLLVIVGSLIVVGTVIHYVSKRDTYKSYNNNSKSTVAEIDNKLHLETKEEIDLIFYEYNADDDCERPKEKKVITISKETYEKNSVEVLNEVFLQTGIEFKSIIFNKDKRLIIADVTKETANNFNRGSTAGIILTNELVMTLLSLPDIEKVQIMVEGKEREYADHYNFDRIFINDENGKYKSIDIDSNK